MTIKKLHEVARTKVYVFNSGDNIEFQKQLHAEGFHIMSKSSVKTSKKEIGFVFNKADMEVFIIIHYSNRFHMIGSGMKLPQGQISEDDKRIFLRRAVVASYCNTVKRELDYQAVLSGTTPLQIGECDWF